MGGYKCTMILVLGLGPGPEAWARRFTPVKIHQVGSCVAVTATCLPCSGWDLMILGTSKAGHHIGKPTSSTCMSQCLPCVPVPDLCSQEIHRLAMTKARALGMASPLKGDQAIALKILTHSLITYPHPAMELAGEQIGTAELHVFASVENFICLRDVLMILGDLCAKKLHLHVDVCIQKVCICIHTNMCLYTHAHTWQNYEPFIV